MSMTRVFRRSHREHASIRGASPAGCHSAAGLFMQKELAGISERHLEYPSLRP